MLTGTSYDSRAFYTCDDGFREIPKSGVRTCGSNGIWSEEVICEGTVLIIIIIISNIKFSKLHFLGEI